MDTKSQVISDTIEFRHAYRTIPTPTPEDRIVQGLHAVTDVLKDNPPPTTISQLEALTNLSGTFESWRLLAPPPAGIHQVPAPGRPRVAVPDHPEPQRTSTPRVDITPRPAWSPPPPAASLLNTRHRDIAPVTP